MENNIDRMVKQANRTLYDDGLVEIGLGLLFLIVTGGTATLLLARSNIGLGLAVGAGVLALVLIGAMVINRLIKQAKSRLVYTRTGYAAYRTNEKSRGRWFVVGLAFVLMILLLTLLPDWAQNISMTYGLLLAAIAVTVGVQMNLKRLYAVAAASVALGIVTAVLQLELVTDGLVMLGGTGIILLASGGLALRSYLAKHPLTENEEAAS